MLIFQFLCSCFSFLLHIILFKIRLQRYEKESDWQKNFLGAVGEGGYFCPVAVLSEGVVRALRRGVAGMGGVYQR